MLKKTKQMLLVHLAQRLPSVFFLPRVQLGNNGNLTYFLCPRALCAFKKLHDFVFLHTLYSLGFSKKNSQNIVYQKYCLKPF